MGTCSKDSRFMSRGGLRAIAERNVGDNGGISCCRNDVMMGSVVKIHGAEE